MNEPELFGVPVAARILAGLALATAVGVAVFLAHVSGEGLLAWVPVPMVVVPVCRPWARGFRVACLVVALLMLPAAFVGLFFGWEFMLPVAVLLIVARAQAAKGRLVGDICLVCGGRLMPAVIESAPPPSQGRLRAVYVCTAYGHRSWRWAESGDPLRRLDGPD